MSLPPYPKYKASGVEWLGQVPAHWQASKLGFVSWVRARLGWKGLTADEYVDDGVAFLATPNIKGSLIDFKNVNFITQARYEESPEIKLRAGDVLLVKDGATLGIVNMVTSLPRPATVNGSIAVITPANDRLQGRFLFYLFDSAYLEHTIQRAKGGMGVPHLFQSDLRKFGVPLPPVPEQTAIAAFLDRETAKIDALVAEQERLIELLKEQRQAVISHAVSKGLKPDVPMKNSGVEWLGDIPAHWEFSSCRRLARPGTSITYGIVQAGPHCEDGVPYVRTSDMSGSALREGEYLRTTNEIDASYARSRVREGDLIVAIRASVGKGLLVPPFLNGANLTQGTAKISPGERLLPLFLFWAFNSDYCQESIRVVAKGSTFLEITLDALRRIQLAVPPRDEQAKIVSFLISETARNDTLTIEAQRAIILLQERRAALISAAVTGQIDVREAASSAA
jgi:type I restriction enzyme S subunit